MTDSNGRINDFRFSESSTPINALTNTKFGLTAGFGVVFSGGIYLGN